MKENQKASSKRPPERLDILNKLHTSWHIYLTDFYSFLTYWGTTGFDSKASDNVSIPRTEIMLVKLISTFLNGEDNYALAA